MVDRATSARVDRSEAVQHLVGELGDWSTGGGPLFRQLARAIAAGIERGAVASGTRLPAERALAAALSVSRGTAVAAYVELVADAPDSPHLSIADSTAAYVLLHADQDRSLTPDHVAVLDRALAQTDRPYVNEIVPGAEHGYTMSDTARWNEDATRRASTELRALFELR